MRPEVAQLVERTRAASGVPPVVSDPLILEAVGLLLEVRKPRAQADAGQTETEAA